MKRSLRIAVCGAAGLVGREMLAILSERSFPCASITALDQAQHAGESVPFAETELDVHELSRSSFKGIDLALFSAEDSVSREFAPLAQAEGAVVVDLSGAWRKDARCPMVCAGINDDLLEGHSGIIASPRSAAIQLFTVLKPLHEAAGIERMAVTSLHAVSGSGNDGVEELEHQVRQLFNMQQPEAEFYPHQIAFNCLPQVGDFLEGDLTEEEEGLAAETRALLGADLPIAATSVRVPGFYGHSQAVTITTGRELPAAEARVLLTQSAGVQVVDNPRASLYPMACDASGEDEVFVGRIRQAAGCGNTLGLWIVADNVRRGAALNAVLIAEELLKRDLVSVPAPGIFLPRG